jgi:erythromycin esterase
MKKKSQPQRNSHPVYPTLDDWIRGDAILFSPDSSGIFNAAVDNVISLIDYRVELLGFGEALHGGEDILLLRNRIFQRLVEKHGYSAIAIESSFPRAHMVNDYLCNRGPASYEEIQDNGFSHGFGRLTANRDLIEWMKQYNVDHSHHVKVRFYGIDSPTEMTGTDSPRQMLFFMLDYLASIEGNNVARRKRIDSLCGPDADWENPAALMNPANSVGLSEAARSLRIETEDLITELSIRGPELIEKTDTYRFFEVMQYARVARQLLNYHAAMAKNSKQRVSELLGIRDAMIADNLAYVASCERGRGKVFVFAHNRHLQRGKVEWQLGPYLNRWWPAGAHLSEMFGERYVVIGSGLGTSYENGINQPEPGTLEALLTGLPKPALFIPTHKGRGLPALEIASLPMRSGSMKNTTYAPLTSENFTDLDWFAILHSTTYSKGGPPL